MCNGHTQLPVVGQKKKKILQSMRQFLAAHAQRDQQLLFAEAGQLLDQIPGIGFLR